MCKPICFCHRCQKELSYYQPPHHQLYHGFASARLKLSRASAAPGSPVCFALLGSFSFNWQSGWSWLDEKAMFLIHLDPNHLFARLPLCRFPWQPLEMLVGERGPWCPPAVGPIPQCAPVQKYIEFCLFLEAQVPLLGGSLLNTHQRATTRK